MSMMCLCAMVVVRGNSLNATCVSKVKHSQSIYQHLPNRKGTSITPISSSQRSANCVPNQTDCYPQSAATLFEQIVIVAKGDLAKAITRMTNFHNIRQKYKFADLDKEATVGIHKVAYQLPPTALSLSLWHCLSASLALHHAVPPHCHSHMPVQIAWGVKFHEFMYGADGVTEFVVKISALFGLGVASIFCLLG